MQTYKKKSNCLKLFEKKDSTTTKRIARNKIIKNKREYKNQPQHHESAGVNDRIYGIITYV